MAVNDTDITVVGWVGSDPLHVTGDEGQVPFTRFRLACTPRVYDREHDTFVDGRTSWYTVKAFRQLARHISESLRRGDPVLVHGRLAMADWVAADGTTRTSAEITADAAGHDLSRGMTRFTRAVHEPRAGAEQAGTGTGPGERRADDGGAPLLDITGATELADDEPVPVDEPVAVGAAA